MILPYIDTAGIELFNTGRLVNYLRQINTARLSGLWEVSADSPCARLNYTFGGTLRDDISPLDDWEASGVPAWVDPDWPESSEFLGMVITDIKGLSSPVSRALTPRMEGGGNLGPQRREPRAVTVTGLLVGTPCGTRYGLRWLGDYLRDPGCAECANPRVPDGSYGFFKCCPPVGEGADYYAGYWQILDAWPTVFPVGKHIDPRNETESDLAAAGCDFIETSFTVTAVNPFLYKERVLLAEASDGSVLVDVPAPVIGTDPVYVLFGDTTSGNIAVDGVTVLTFSGLPSGSSAVYDAARRRFTYSNAPAGIVNLDAAKFIADFGDYGSDGLFTWLEADRRCGGGIPNLSALSENYVAVGVQHREG